jgi:WD40 repeat protein
LVEGATLGSHDLPGIGAFVVQRNGAIHIGSNKEETMALCLQFFHLILLCSGWDDHDAKPAAFELVEEHQVRERGGATHIFSVDDATILTADSKMDVHIWKYDNTAKLQLLSTHRKNWCSWNYAYSSSNKLLAYPNEKNNGVFIYQITKGANLEKVKVLDWSATISKGPTLELCFSPDGSLFSHSCHHRKSIEVLETKTYRTVLSLPHNEYVDWLRFLDNDLLLSISDTNTLRVWKLSKKSASILLECNIPKRGWEILDTRYNSDKRKLVVWYGLPDRYAGYTEIEVKEGGSVRHGKMKENTRDAILALRMSPDMDYVVIGTGGSEVIVFDYKTTKEIYRKTIRDRPWSVLFLENGDKFIAGCVDGSVALFSRKAQVDKR